MNCRCNTQPPNRSCASTQLMLLSYRIDKPSISHTTMEETEHFGHRAEGGLRGEIVLFSVWLLHYLPKDIVNSAIAM